jgi:hypothetical protein
MIKTDDFLTVLATKLGLSTVNKEKENLKVLEKIYHPFRLPILYLDKNVFPIPKSVVDDLELHTMYNYLLTPRNEFGIQMINEWKKQFTTDIQFLEETQIVLKDMSFFQDKENIVNTDNIMRVWDDTKKNDYFLEKYDYMDWNQFMYLNKSSNFLQLLSSVNILSPLLSLIVPIIFLIFPFLILKIQGIPISFANYISILKETAKHHFIGKTILNIQNLSWDKLFYMILTFGLFVMQVYQNINTCTNFYKNIQTINTNLLDIRDYIDKITKKMDRFIELHIKKNKYTVFCMDLRKHSTVLYKFQSELLNITPFKHNLTKATECGKLLKCYFEFKNDKDYDESLRFSIGFEGYIDNMSGIFQNLQSQKISLADFDDTKNTTVLLKKQYYPPFKDTATVVKNNIKLKKNIILTGPNASGKTTILKTTAINVIFSQQFGCGFYKKCILNPYSHIHSYLNIPDTSERDSLFQSESRRCKDILDIINNAGCDSRHLCIFDELYSGTNPIEASQTASAFLSYLSKYKKVNFILTTHYIDICDKICAIKNICNHKMNVIKCDENTMKYTYKMSKGISKVQGAICVLKEMCYPEEIIKSITSNMLS